MDVIEIAGKRQLLREARLKMKPVWVIATKPSRRRRNVQIAVQDLLKEISQLINLEEEGNDKFDSSSSMKLRQLVKRGLYLDPKLHTFYAIRGTIAMRQAKWSEAIESYESARLFMKHEKKLWSPSLKYDENLIECYWARGCDHYENGLMLEAANDYERILTIRPGHIMAEDKLLTVLSAMGKYEAYRYCWRIFLSETSDNVRMATLLARYAGFKVRLRDTNEARLMLFEALDLDPDNQLARKLFQVIHDTGRVLAVHTVIWCMHGCYEKALFTIEKVRNCDPYDPGYTLLRTIVLRLSGRPIEAAEWLENVNKRFDKLFYSTTDLASGLDRRKLDIDRTRRELIKQWYLTRYDMAINYAIEEKFAEASQIILDCRLQRVYPEVGTLLKQISILQRRKLLTRS